MPDARIRKWTKPKLWGLMIADQQYWEFHRHFAPLLRQAGHETGIQLDVCSGTLKHGKIHTPLGPSCERASFDFYYVITNGNWTDAEWDPVQRALQGQAGEVLAKVRELLATASEGKTCRYMIRTSDEVANRIELGVAVIDSNQPLVLGTCGTYAFLHMMGLYPFDGPQPLDPNKESESLAEFLLKPTPYGGEHLLRILYSPAVEPGMQEGEFIRTLPQ